MLQQVKQVIKKYATWICSIKARVTTIINIEPCGTGCDMLLVALQSFYLEIEKIPC